ncbi:MAG TPA: MmcQ/YjbR family DNA-binding protein [Candidatus Baltobacteraceae bacterium]|nr:MmcQ/YjbR family DNA-binding protein [Candidatus Baltobacteraceae bacterium]
MATWSDVSRIALALPGVTEEPSYGGTRSWKVNDKGVVWERPLRKADLDWLGERAPKGPVLGVRVPETEMKEVLLKADPNVFFTTPHFDGYPAVLIRLDKISLKQLKDVILEAWLCRAPKRAAEAYLKRRK